MPETQKKSIPRWLYMAITGAAVFAVVSYVNSSKSTAPTAAAAILPAYIQADSLASKLSGTPLHYNFTKSTSGTWYVNRTAYINTLGSTSPSKSDCDNITIQYNDSTREIQSIKFYCNRITNTDPKLSDATTLFDFLDYYNPQASEYYKTRFAKIISDQDYLSNLAPYIDTNHHFKYFIDHSIFTARALQAKDPKQIIIPGSLYIMVEITNLQYSKKNGTS